MTKSETVDFTPQQYMKTLKHLEAIKDVKVYSLEQLENIFIESDVTVLEYFNRPYISEGNLEKDGCYICLVYFYSLILRVVYGFPVIEDDTDLNLPWNHEIEKIIKYMTTTWED